MENRPAPFPLSPVWWFFVFVFLGRALLRNGASKTEQNRTVHRIRTVPARFFISSVLSPTARPQPQSHRVVCPHQRRPRLTLFRVASEYGPWPFVHIVRGTTWGKYCVDRRRPALEAGQMIQRKPCGGGTTWLLAMKKQENIPCQNMARYVGARRCAKLSTRSNKFAKKLAEANMETRLVF